jgi:hypothetical protein
VSQAATLRWEGLPIVSAPIFPCSKVHISHATRTALKGKFLLESAHGKTRNTILKEQSIETYFVVGYSLTEVSHVM